MLMCRSFGAVCCSEQHLASLLWPPPLNQAVFARLAAPYLTALAASAAEITEARKSPDRVGSEIVFMAVVI